MIWLTLRQDGVRVYVNPYKLSYYRDSPDGPGTLLVFANGELLRVDETVETVSSKISEVMD